jgi:hypothetical protein
MGGGEKTYSCPLPDRIADNKMRNSQFIHELRITEKLTERLGVCWRFMEVYGASFFSFATSQSDFLLL